MQTATQQVRATPVGALPGHAPWPFGELTREQRLNIAEQQACMRAGTLRGLPTCFGALT